MGMQLIQEQRQKQNQTQRLTLKQRQGLELLQMQSQDLKQRITQELEQNPFLELEEEDETALPAEASDPAPEWNEPEENPDREDSTIDIDWETDFEDRVSVSERVNSRYSDTDELQPDLAYERSLHEYLAEQLALAPPEVIGSETERAIGEQILGNLNDDGQLELKLFQIPSEFLPELEKENLSIELHIFIQKNLQSATGDPNIQFSESATIAVQDTMSASTENRGMSVNRAWKINDKDNQKVYTILCEYMPCSHKATLNFYQLTLDDIAETVGCDVSVVEAVLRKIQDNFEPLGIAHRDLREALLIQIRNDESAVSGQQSAVSKKTGREEQISIRCLAQEIVENHFDAFLNQKREQIADALRVDITAIEEVVTWIGRLSPHPGRCFTDPTDWLWKKPASTPITPDVEIKYLNGTYQVIGVDPHIPYVRLNSNYLKLMQNGENLDAEAKEWIEKRYRKATDLISNIARRGSTITQVTEEIFAVQTEFFTLGAKGIKPLTLRMIAEKIGIHESTVSRVTSTKYVQTPHGMYPLRFFFSNALTTTRGDSVSKTQVQTLVQEIIDAENPLKPLSDQAISDALLKKHGIRIGGRTVANYRTQLNIPPSPERKECRQDRVR